MRKTGFALVSLVLVTACGSTVQVTGSGAAAGQGTTATGGTGEGLSAPGGAVDAGSLPVAGSSGGSTASTGASVRGVGSGASGGSDGAVGSSAQGTTGTATGQGSSSGGTTGATTTSANTRPITIGILNTGSNAALAAGFGKKGTTSTWQGSDEALIRWFNKHGGIGGRQIRTVAYTVDATSTSYSTDVQAACQRFTQDNKVDVVLTTAGTGSFDALESCLSKARIVNIEAYDQGNTDAGTFARYPTLVTVGAPVVDHAVRATLRGLSGTGYLTSKNKVGVIVEACPYNVRVYEQSYAPLAKQLGLTVSRRDVQCVNGAGDLGSFAQQVSTSVLPFRSAGIDRVSAISDFESLAVLAFSDQAESQGWRPGYALTSAAHTGAYQPQLSQPQLPQMVGVGNLPDVDLTSRGTPTGTVARCRSTLASEGITGSAPADFSIMDTACDVWWLLNDALLNSHGQTAGLALVPALHAIGTSHASASVLGGATRYDADHRDGQPLSAVYAYQAACTCFRYTTKPAHLE